jgi:DNA-binding transcriptional ArsR family regulator
MLRVHFTSDDIARTRIAPGPDPLWELVLALQMLSSQRGDVCFTGWRREAIDVLRRANVGPSLRLLLALTRDVGYVPDFLTPADAVHGLEKGLEAIRSTSKPRLRRDIQRLALSRSLPAGAGAVADGDPRALAELTDRMRLCHELLVAPCRHLVQTAVDHDRSVRVRALASGGVEGLLGSLRPMAMWSSEELLVPVHRDQELHLDGRGLLLIPSYFCVSGPITLLDPALPPVLVHPVQSRETPPFRGHRTPPALGALIGVTRATVLGALSSNAVTTSNLARQVGISAASASEHATILRQAGLLASYRDRNRMLHHVTPLGAALMDRNL